MHWVKLDLSNHNAFKNQQICLNRVKSNFKNCEEIMSHSKCTLNVILLMYLTFMDPYIDSHAYANNTSIYD